MKTSCAVSNQRESERDGETSAAASELFNRTVSIKIRTQTPNDDHAREIRNLSHCTVYSGMPRQWLTVDGVRKNLKMELPN